MRQGTSQALVKKAGCNEHGDVAAIVHKDGEEKVLVIHPIIASLPEYFIKSGKISYMTNVKSVVEIWLQSDAPLFFHLDDEKDEFHLYTFYKDICYLLKLKKWQVERGMQKIFEEIIALKK